MSKRGGVNRNRPNIPKDGLGARMNYSPTVMGTVQYEQVYRRVLSELAISRFKWTGLPKTVDERFMETMLHYQGLVVFYWDTDYDRYLALRGSGAGEWNMYDNPTSFIVTGNRQVNRSLSAKQCVPIWSNYLREPDVLITNMYAHRLAEAERTIDINMLNERHPWVVSVNANERLSLVNAFRNVQEGAPVIWGTENFTPDALEKKINTFNVGQDREATLNMMTVRMRLWNDCMTLLGIQNTNSDKRERMVVDEVNANDGQVKAARNVALMVRQEAANQINRMYPGLNVQVDWNEESQVIAPSLRGSDDMSDDTDTEGEDDA